MRVNTDQRVAELEAELRDTKNRLAWFDRELERAHQQIAEMEAEAEEKFEAKINTDPRVNTDQRVAELEAELETYRDPWLEPIRKFLEERPYAHRFHSIEILRDAELLDRRLLVTKTDERRLADIMRRIGGWRPSENVGGRYDRGRGYIRDR